MAYDTTFRRRHHPLLAPTNAWTWKFLPGVLLGFALKWWCDNGNKDGAGQKSVQKTNKLLASKSAVTTDEEYKMMGKGKIAAQCSHAAVGVVEQHKQHAAEVFQQWELKGHAKVALRAPTEAEMLSIAGDAVNAGIFTYLVVDAGRTQIAPGSRTVLAIGPAPKSQVDKLTGHLKLL